MRDLFRAHLTQKPTFSRGSLSFLIGVPKPELGNQRNPKLEDRAAMEDGATIVEAFRTKEQGKGIRLSAEPQSQTA
jgi:hypothetical protein